MASPIATDEPVPEEPVEVVNVTEDGGVVKRVLRRGPLADDVPPRNCEVKVHYTGRLEDGTVFDSSRERNEPFVFRLGAGKVIRAWDLGVATMAVGERAELVCRSDYAYGDSGSPPKIPGGATLTFDVQVLGYNTRKPVTEDGGVMKEELRQGDGYNRPNLFGTVTVRYTGRVGTPDGEVFDGAHAEEPVTFVLDEDMDRPRGLEEGIKHMLRGEKSRFYVRQPYGRRGGAPDEELVYDVELLSFEKGRETWEMSTEEKLQHAARLKERGNAHFARREFEDAVAWYGRANNVFQYEPSDLSEEDRASVKRLKCAASSNLGACYLNTKDYPAAVRACTEALEAVPGTVKALCRRSTAHLSLGNLDLAEHDAVAAAEADAGNVTAGRILKEVKARKRKAREKERQLYGNAFARVSLT